MVEKVKSPSNIFNVRVDCSKQTEFDKYYIDPEYKKVYKKVGVDSAGDEIGTIETKIIIRKRDIAEVMAEQADLVGVEAYMKAMAIQGVSGDEFFTNVDLDNVQDFTDAPDNKFDGVLYGKKAVELFNNLDPALRGSHTTIEGFLNSLTKDTIDNYIKGRVDAAFPKKDTEAGGDK